MSTLRSKSVKSINLCKSVIQTSYDIVQAHGGEINVESSTSDQLGLSADDVGQEESGTIFTIQLPI